MPEALGSSPCWDLFFHHLWHLLAGLFVQSTLLWLALIFILASQKNIKLLTHYHWQWVLSRWLFWNFLFFFFLDYLLNIFTIFSPFVFSKHHLNMGVKILVSFVFISPFLSYHMAYMHMILLFFSPLKFMCFFFLF